MMYSGPTLSFYFAHISLLHSETERPFVRLLTVQITSWMKHLFRFAHFPNGLPVLFLLISQSPLYMLDADVLFAVCIANIFFHV